MKKKMLVAAMIAFGVSSGAALAGEPCAAVLCLSTNKMAPHQCKGAVDDYFAIKVRVKPCKYCGEIFDPGATAIKRLREVLEKCPDARDEDRDYVTATYGSLEFSPFDYNVVDEKSGQDAGYAQESKETATESRFFTCQQAASMPEYSSAVGAPYAGLWNNAYPDTVVNADMPESTLYIQGGYVNRYLGTSGGEIVDGAKTPVETHYGYAIQQRTVQRTVGQHKVLSASDWRTVRTMNCSLKDYVASQDTGGGG